MSLRPVIVPKEIPVNRIGKLIDGFLKNSNRVNGFERIYYKWKDIPDNHKIQARMFNFRTKSNQYNFHKLPLASLKNQIQISEEIRLRKLFPDLPHNTVALSMIGHQGRKVEFQLSKLKFLKKDFDFRHLLLSIPTTMDDFMFQNDFIVVDEFEFDKSNLVREQKDKLNFFVEFVKRTYDQRSSERYRPIKGISIYGATDKVGQDDYNYALGLERSEEVKKYIKGKIRYAKVEVQTPLGESRPRVDTDEPEGKNRLVLMTFHYHPLVKEAARDIQIRVQNVLIEKKDRLNQLYYKQFSRLVSYIGDESKDDKFLTLSDILNAARKESQGKENDMKHFRQTLLRFDYTRRPSDEALYEFARQSFDRIQDFVIGAKKLAAKSMPGVLPGTKTEHLNKWEKEILAFYQFRAQEKYDYPNIFECFRT